MKHSPWDCEEIENIFVPVDVEEYECALDEWAEMMYRHLCQLHEKNSLVPESLTPKTAEGTGSDE